MKILALVGITIILFGCGTSGALKFVRNKDYSENKSSELNQLGTENITSYNSLNTKPIFLTIEESEISTQENNVELIKPKSSLIQLNVVGVEEYEVSTVNVNDDLDPKSKDDKLEAKLISTKKIFKAGWIIAIVGAVITMLAVMGIILRLNFFSSMLLLGLGLLFASVVLLIIGLIRKKKLMFESKYVPSEHSESVKKTLTMAKLSFIPAIGFIFSLITFNKANRLLEILEVNEDPYSDYGMTLKAKKAATMTILMGLGIIFILAVGFILGIKGIL